MLGGMKKIIIVSEGTGNTSRRMMETVLGQYSRLKLDVKLDNVFPQVHTRKQVREILADLDSDYLVIFSIVSKELREYAHSLLQKRGILHLSILDPMLETIEKFLGFHPEYEPGLRQIVDNRYYQKVDSMGYTVGHDDGRGHQLDQADIILLGPSRTCKTPISIYLACNHGVKVANIPIIPDEGMEEILLSRLENIRRRRIVGLIMEADVLIGIRTERSRLLTGSSAARQSIRPYCDADEIRREIRYCNTLFQELEIKTVNVTWRAIEEISLEVLKAVGIERKPALSSPDLRHGT
jgi:regulator of PEP synthase PpsR (kinase-PPPase family)